MTLIKYKYINTIYKFHLWRYFLFEVDDFKVLEKLILLNIFLSENLLYLQDSYFSDDFKNLKSVSQYELVSVLVLLLSRICFIFFFLIN